MPPGAASAPAGGRPGCPERDRPVGGRWPLVDLRGIGPSGATRLLVDVDDIARFLDRSHFAPWTGTAPSDASSGDHVRHRLSRGGNRQINRTIHTMATVQLRNQTEGRAYYDDRKKLGGKISMEAMLCIKRRLSDTVYRTMLATSQRTQRRAREGNTETTLPPARQALIPTPALRTSDLRGRAGRPWRSGASSSTDPRRH